MNESENNQVILPDIKLIYAAKRDINQVINQTPLLQNLSLSDKYQANILLKREDLQKTRSYKLRGAYLKISLLSDKKQKRGVVCASAGNHAQGFTFTCNELNIKGKIFMPTTTSNQKIKQVRMYGKENIETIVTVPEGKICTAILELYNEEALVVEPAGALSIAALDFFQEDIKGKNVVCIASGGNNDITRMEEIKYEYLNDQSDLFHYII